MDDVDAFGTWVSVACPHCFEETDVLIEAEDAGSWVQDCEVCCNPWQVTVRRSGSSEPVVEVEPL